MAKPQLPAAEDPDNVREIFASETVNAAVMDGVIRLTFVVGRMEHSGVEKEPTPRRVVVARLALTLGAAQQLDAYLSQIKAAMIADQHRSMPDDKIN